MFCDRIRSEFSGILKRLLVVIGCGVGVLCVSRSAIAQNCDWTPGATSTSPITETCGSVGIGTATPSAKLQVEFADATAYAGAVPSIADVQFAFRNSANGANVFSGFQINNYGDSQNRIGYIGGVSESNVNRNLALVFGTDESGNRSEKMRIASSGNVGIGTTAPSSKLHVVGDVTVTGNIAAKYQDLAEWVPAREGLKAGTVVILDVGRRNTVVPSMAAYDTRVAGVVSERPGVILGEGGEGKAMIATAGRVKVKVDAGRGPVRVGDLLVTSDREGYAMRSEPIEVTGIAIHRPGTLIGKALEPLEKGQQGEILVLLSLQ